MILHCMPPYNQHIPNPALGYLKGFLQDKGFKTKNVYWNLILAQILSRFSRGLFTYSDSKDFFSLFPSIFLGRQLVKEDIECETPLQALYLSIYSKEEISNMVGKTREYIDSYIIRHHLEKDIAGFSLKTYQWLIAMYIMNRLRELNPDITIVVGGITSQSQGEAYMRVLPQADFAIVGEGEYPLLYLLKTLREGGTLQKVPSLFYREEDRIQFTSPLSGYPPLDEYPFADHTDFVTTFQQYMTGDALTQYIDTYGKHPSDRLPIVIPIWGSRSCSWNKCKFCVLNEGPYRNRSCENIVEEIEFQSEAHQVNSFFFMDTETAGNLKRFKKLLKLIIASSAKKKKQYHFIAELSPLFITPETAHLMELASFQDIQIGFEAMTDPLLQKISKRHTFAHNIQALKLGGRHNLNLHGLQIIRGLPSETREDIMESFHNLKFLRFFLSDNTLIAGFLRLDKGSPFYNEMSEEKRKEWTNSPLWTEIEPVQLLPEADRFEFFGFCRPSPGNLWADFRNLVQFYTDQGRTYRWVEHEGGSFVEEKGLRLYKFIFDRNETNILIFCDTIKSLSEIKKKFPHLDEKLLLDILQDLMDAGFIYADRKMRRIVSVLDAPGRKMLIFKDQ